MALPELPGQAQGQRSARAKPMADLVALRRTCLGAALSQCNLLDLSAPWSLPRNSHFSPLAGSECIGVWQCLLCMQCLLCALPNARPERATGFNYRSFPRVCHDTFIIVWCESKPMFKRGSGGISHQRVYLHVGREARKP